MVYFIVSTIRSKALWRPSAYEDRDREQTRQHCQWLGLKRLTNSMVCMNLYGPQFPIIDMVIIVIMQLVSLVDQIPCLQKHIFSQILVLSCGFKPLNIF